MHVGVCHLSLKLHGNRSLKGKRQVARSIVCKVRARFNVSIAEVEDNELWQRLTLGICCVSNDGRYANETLSQVLRYIEDTRPDVEVLEYELEMVSGI